MRRLPLAVCPRPVRREAGRTRAALVSVALAALALAACGHKTPSTPPVDAAPADAPIDAPMPPAFRHPLPDLTDDQVALRSLQLLGGPVDGAQRDCNACHGITQQHLIAWEQLANNATTYCLTNFAVTDPAAAREMVTCLRSNPLDPTSAFAPSRLGFYAIGAQLPWFDYLFHLASPSTGDADYAAFLDRVAMPRGDHPKLTQDEFDVVAEWVARGLPLLDQYVMDNTSGPCTTSIAPSVADHVQQLATTGWQAVNASNGLDMFGCAGAASTRACLASYPDAASTAYGAHWEDDLSGGVIRILRTNNYESAFWTRSSADGRFVAHGGSSQPGASSTIVDLQTDTLIGTSAFYDPGFFPDNSGFAFQGGGDAHICDQRLLSATPPPSYIDYSEPECATASQVGLYQHLGRALNGGDYWTVNGEFVSDNGGHSATTQDTPAYFDSDATIELTPLVFTGTTYQQKPAITVAVPSEGDTVLSPSATWLISRVGGSGGAQNGYVLRELDATPMGNTYTVSVPVIARYCLKGEKPAFSFDERWLVYHHYVTDADATDLGFTGPNDPEFQAYRSQGAANLYLVDLLTGDRTRITRMAPGQYALYPHFRSDGWIYFLVRIANTNTEYIAASDAELLVSGQP